MKKELVEAAVKRAISAASESTFADEFVALLLGQGAAEKARSDYRGKLERERERHGAEVSKIESELLAAQKACPHLLVKTTYGCGHDPSERTCDTCGKEVL